MKLGVAVWHGHVSWLADAGKSVVLLHERLNLLSGNASEEIVEPGLQIVSDTRLECIRVPGEIRHHGKLQGCLLGIGYVGYPGTVLVVMSLVAVGFLTAI